MNMLPVNRINDIALKVATANLGPANVTSVVASTVISSSSVEALQITIVLAPGSASTVTGEIAANTVFDMNVFQSFDTARPKRGHPESRTFV
jgi:hypothetical protein